MKQIVQLDFEPSNRLRLENVGDRNFGGGLKILNINYSKCYSTLSGIRVFLYIIVNNKRWVLNIN